VGYRLGAAIRAAQASPQHSESGGTHARPRPHIRRAHWHGYWTGPRAKPAKERKFVLRWLAPIPVNVSEETPTIPTIHEVN
jgi:hypothetical protein